jgi:hypothetical protein
MWQGLLLMIMNILILIIVLKMRNKITSTSTFEFTTKITENFNEVQLGLYQIFWKDKEGGGYSYASIGNLHDGCRWVAPINWTSKEDPTGRMDEIEDNIKYMIRLK